MTSKNTSFKKIKVAIILLAILFFVILFVLIGRLVYINFFADKGATVVVPDNIIGEESAAMAVGDAITSDAVGSDLFPEDNSSGKGTLSSAEQGSSGAADANTATTISLHRLKDNDNIPFKAENMLPGDSITQYFRVKISHTKPVTLYFDTEIKEQTGNLGNVLNIKVTHLDTDNVLYGGSFNDMSPKGYSEKISASKSGETFAYYKIDVSLDTSVGNEYQVSALLADFNWYVNDSDDLDLPETGDSSNIILAVIVAVIALAVVVLLLIIGLKKEKKDGQ